MDENRESIRFVSERKPLRSFKGLGKLRLINLKEINVSITHIISM